VSGIRAAVTCLLIVIYFCVYVTDKVIVAEIHMHKQRRKLGANATILIQSQNYCYDSRIVCQSITVKDFADSLCATPPTMSKH